MKFVIVNNQTLTFVMSWDVSDTFKDLPNPEVHNGRMFGFDSRGAKAERYKHEQVGPILDFLKIRFPTQSFTVIPQEG